MKIKGIQWFDVNGEFSDFIYNIIHTNKNNYQHINILVHTEICVRFSKIGYLDWTSKGVFERGASEYVHRIAFIDDLEA